MRNFRPVFSRSQLLPPAQLGLDEVTLGGGLVLLHPHEVELVGGPELVHVLLEVVDLGLDLLVRVDADLLLDLAPLAAEEGALVVVARGHPSLGVAEAGALRYHPPVLAVALGSVLALTVCTTLAPAAVLLAPDAAVAAAAGAPPLRRAEILLLAGRPAEARAALVGAAADDPRALRILAESFALEVDLVGARPALAALAALPTWASPARQTEAHLARARGARAVVRGGES
jgi:hypothetical protein